MAIANFLIKENLVDMDYIKNYTLGFDDFAERARQFSLDHAHEVTGGCSGNQGFGALDGE